MTQKRKKVKKNQPQKRTKPQAQNDKGVFNRAGAPKADLQITVETAVLLSQLVNNLQELHGWEGTILHKLNKIIDTLG